MVVIDSYYLESAFSSLTPAIVLSSIFHPSESIAGEGKGEMELSERVRTLEAENRLLRGGLAAIVNVCELHSVSTKLLVRPRC